MLNYEEFVEAIKEQIGEHLPEGMTMDNVRFGKTSKVNRELDTLSIIPDGDVRAVPCMYLQDAYEKYLESEDIELELNNMIQAIGRFEGMAPTVPDFNRAALSDKIICEVINTAQNEEYLEGLPHRDFEDLSVIYRAVVASEDENVGSVVITNDLAESMNFTEEELYELAKENVMEIMTPEVRTMQDVLMGMLTASGHDQEEISEMLGAGVLPENTMFVVTNRQGVMGANAILFPEVFERVAERLGTDLFILPSSRHELIAVSSEFGSLEEAAAMVQSVNMEQVRMEDRLSNQVYKYDRDARVITCATDTPYKKLDGTREEERDREPMKREAR